MQTNNSYFLLSIKTAVLITNYNFSYKVCLSRLYVSPCGRHILFFPSCMSVRPSVRPSVPCPCVTLPLSEPYLQEPFIEKN